MTLDEFARLKPFKGRVSKLERIPYKNVPSSASGPDYRITVVKPDGSVIVIERIETYIGGSLRLTKLADKPECDLPAEIVQCAANSFGDTKRRATPSAMVATLAEHAGSQGSTDGNRSSQPMALTSRSRPPQAKGWEGFYVGTVSGVGTVQVTLMRDRELKRPKVIYGSCSVTGIAKSFDVEGSWGSDGRAHLRILKSGPTPDHRDETVARLDGTIETRTSRFRGIWVAADQSKGVAFTLRRAGVFRELDRGWERGEFRATFAAYYPHLEGPSRFYQEVNAALEKSCEEQHSGFIADFQGAAEDRLTSPDWEATQEIEIVWSNENLVSALCRWTQFTGGAHGLAGSFTRNFDTSDGRAKEFQLSELFRSDSGWEKRLSDYCIASLREQEASFVVDGTIKRLSAYDLGRFTVSEGGIQIYFSPYDVASWAASGFTVDVPWAVVGNCVDTNGPARPARFLRLINLDNDGIPTKQ